MYFLNLAPGVKERTFSSGFFRKKKQRQTYYNFAKLELRYVGFSIQAVTLVDFYLEYVILVDPINIISFLCIQC